MDMKKPHLVAGLIAGHDRLTDRVDGAARALQDGLTDYVANRGEGVDRDGNRYAEDRAPRFEMSSHGRQSTAYCAARVSKIHRKAVAA